MIDLKADALAMCAAALNIFENCEVSSGYCMCGDKMEGHPLDHMPQDQGQYYATMWADTARVLLAQAQGDTP